MKIFNLIEMAKAMKEHKLRHMWRYAAMMALLLTLVCGQAWGTSPLTVSAPSQYTTTQDGVTVQGTYASEKFNNTNSQAVFKTNNSSSVFIYSLSTNITSITFDACKYNDGAGNCLDINYSTGGAFTNSTTGITATKDGNSLASLSSINLNGQNGTANAISITFSSPVKAIVLSKSTDIRVRNISVAYDTPSTPTTYFAAHFTGASTANIDTDPGSASTTAPTNGNTTVDSRTFYKLNGDVTIDLGSGHTFQAGDQIVVEVGGSGTNKSQGIVFKTSSGTSVATLSAGHGTTAFAHKYLYVVQASDGIQGQQTAKFNHSVTDTRVYSWSVLRTAASTWNLKGSWDSYTPHKMTEADGSASLSVDLAADTRYEFGFDDNGKNFYKNSGTIITNTTWTFNTSDNNCKIHTGPAGSYTFSINTTTKSVTVTYPEVTHPNDHYVYFKKPDGWGSVKGYLGNTGNDNKAAAWPGSDMTATTSICDETYYYAALNAMSGTYNVIIFNNGSSGVGNQSWDLSTTDYLGKYNACSDGDWHDFTSYTISYNNGGGSGTMSSQSVYCGNDKTTSTNTFTKTGYTFANWHANVNVTVGGSTVDAGEDIDNGAELQNVTSNITLTAQWSAKSCSVTFDMNGGSSASTGTTATYDAAMTSVTPPTRAGYNFAGYYDSESEDDGTGTIYYNADGTSARNWDKDVTSNQTLYAKWTVQTYKISYKDGGATDNISFSGYSIGTAPTTHTYGTATTLKKACKADYVFGGWYKEYGLTNDMNLSVGATEKTADFNLYAKWTAMSLTALANNTVYTASDMVPDGVTVGSEQYYPGVSANNRFNLLGTGTSNADGGPVSSKTVEEYDLEDGTQDVTEIIYFKKTASPSSNIPAHHAVQFEVPAAGQLEVWTESQGIYLSNGTTETEINATHKKVTVSAGTHYLYAKGTGKNLYGIRFRQQYAVTYNPTNASKSSGAANVYYGEDFEATFTASAYHTLPSDVTVTIGGASKTKGTDYSWSVSKGVGTLSIAGSKVTGAIVVTFTATANTYTVTHTTSNVTETSCPTSATYGTNYSATYSESTGYDLPSTIGVTIGGNDATVDVDYTWSVSNGEGTFAIAGAKITGNIVVSVTGVAECTTVLTPDELAIDSKTYNSVTFGWYGPDLPTGTIDYEVYAEVKDDGTKVLDWTSTSGDNNYTVTGLDPNTEYTFKVKAVGNTEGGYCEYSDVATIDGTTNKAPLSLTLTYASLSLTTGDVTAAPTLTGNSGGGAVTYSVTSATPAGCATVVSGTGVVTAVAAGTATVTVNVAAAGDYLAGSTTAVFTISDPCFYADDLKKSSDLGFTAGSTLDATKVSGSITGGAISNSSATATIGGNDKYGLIIDSEDKKVTVTLTSPNIFQAGTVITIGAHVSDKAETGTSKTSGFTVGGNTPTPASKTSESKAEAFTQTYTVVADDGIEGTNHFEIALKSSADKSYIRSIKVTGCGTASGYTVTYADGGATSGSVPTDASSPYEEGATVTVLGNTGSLAKTGYTFAGWNDGSTDYTAGNTFTMPDENVTLTAQWTEDTHTVSVAAGAHGTVSPSSVSGVGIATASGDITATPSTGYNFSSWDLPSGVTAAAGKTASSNPIQINATADDKTITATWTPINYTITYNLNSGSLDGSQKMSYNIETEDYDLPTPTRDDYVFQGWYTDEDLTSDRVYTLAEGSTGDKTYYAKWADDLTINWTITKVSSKLYKGGTDYTVTAVVDDADWDASGSANDLVLSASDGVTLSNIAKSVDGTSGKAQVVANFSVAGDVEGDKIYFTLSVPAAGDYSAIDDEKEVELDDCPGGSTTVTLTHFDTSNTDCSKDDKPDSQKKYLYGYKSSTMTSANAYTITTSASDNKGANSNVELILKYDSNVRIYADNATTSAATGFTGVTAVSFKWMFIASGSSGTASRTVYYTVKVGSTKVADAVSISGKTSDGYATINITGISNLDGYVEISTDGSSTSDNWYIDDISITYSGSGGEATSLAWSESLADKATVNKRDIDADFQYYASPTPSNAGGPISYTSSDKSVATVSSNGTVHIVGDGSTTITAAMPAYGCYSAATSITYSLVVANTCADTPGTIVDNDGNAIAGNKVTRGACETLTLKLTGYSEGASIKWYKDGDEIAGATNATYAVPTGQSGVYSAKSTLTGDSHCSLSSTNSITVTTAGSIDPTIFAKEFTVKSGKPFHYRLMQLNKGESVSVKSTTSWTENTDFVITKDADNIVYISSKTYAGVTIASAGTETITLTISNECGGDPTDKAITIHKITATAKPTVAWIATSTGDTKGVKDCRADQSTTTALYEYLETYYTMTARNCYWETREDSLVKEYSKYDLVILTDYPNSGTCPKGKSGKSNSYTNAIGQLIDYRPIMTFEAFVAGCPNWGIPTDPSNTKDTQKSLTLLCNAEDIFDDDSGKFAAGEDIAITTASSGQALQGFPVASLPDFVFIGKITDSDDKEYVACCERQVNTGARTLIFGLNSALMSNLTDDGKLMVQKFADYLLETDPASIPDCSVIFNGGGSGNSWYTTGNWEGNSLPNQYASVRIDAPCEVPDNASPAKAGRIKIHKGGAFNGSLTIKPAGCMIVEKAITRVDGNEYTVHKQTQPSDVIIETNSTGQGALIFNNESARTQATVKLYSKGSNDGSYQFQYFASPFTEISSWAFEDAYIYTHAENIVPEWTQLHYGEDVYAFQGLGLTADGDAATYEVEGELASTAKHTYNLTYTSSKAKKNGTNIVGNSWTAPIQITRIDDSDFDKPSNFEGTVYIYNAGRDAVQGVGASTDADMSTPGVWQSIPISTAKTAAWKGSRQIPAYQAFQLKVDAPVKFTIDYDKHVRQSATQGGDTLNAPLHAPKHRAMRIEDVEVLRLCVTDINNEYHAHIYLCEGEDFTEGRDKGWEAQQVVGDGKAGKLYAIDESRSYMMSIARPSLEGTPVGFIAGLNTQYVITFNETSGTYYLNDLETQTSTLIQEGESYQFTTTKGNHPNRFFISATPFNAPQTPTSVTDLDAKVPTAQKILYNDKVYIIRGGKMYSIDGQMVK